ncbi:MAG: FlgD immunoglobulin-like domain containing protein, partial [bacterium]
WIPYQLKEGANVEIRIYAMNGQLVRTLNLGHKPAGFYITKERSAYWDGRNEAGESVASGAYFYTIKAGDLVATRKMILLR